MIPTIFVDNFDAAAFDTDGKPDPSRAAAARMMHYPDDDTTVVAPRFVSNASARRSRNVAPRRACPADGDQVYLTTTCAGARAWPMASRRHDARSTLEFLHVNT